MIKLCIGKRKTVWSERTKIEFTLQHLFFNAGTKIYGNCGHSFGVQCADGQAAFARKEMEHVGKVSSSF